MYRKFIKLSLFIIPFLAQFVALPFVNKSHPVILGLPLLQFWLFLWLILSPVCLYIVYRLQKVWGEIE